MMTYVRGVALATCCVVLVIGLLNYNDSIYSIARRQLQAQGGRGQQQQYAGTQSGQEESGEGWGRMQQQQRRVAIDPQSGQEGSSGGWGQVQQQQQVDPPSGQGGSGGGWGKIQQQQQQVTVDTQSAQEGHSGAWGQVQQQQQQFSPQDSHGGSGGGWGQVQQQPQEQVGPQYGQGGGSGGWVKDQTETQSRKGLGSVGSTGWGNQQQQQGGTQSDQGGGFAGWGQQHPQVFPQSGEEEGSQHPKNQPFVGGQQNIVQAMGSEQQLVPRSVLQKGGNFAPNVEVKQQIGSNNAQNEKIQQFGHNISSTNQCQVKSPKEMKVKPTWAASFPGSGIKIFWKTIQGTTGLFTGDDNDSSGQMKRGVVVTVKTHYPSTHVSPKFFLLDTASLKSAILLVRNPVTTLPAYFKFLYRYEFGHGPDAKIPIADWIAWRNENLEVQMKKWVEHTRWWLQQYSASGNLLVVQFEKLVSKSEGPQTLVQIVNFLNSVDPEIGTTKAPDDDMPCLWQELIGDTIPEEKLPKNMKLEAEAPTLPLTLDQLDMISKILKDFKREFSRDPNVDLFIPDFNKGVTVAKRQVEKLLA